MADICYMDLGPDELLSSIVMAGSHDAGITGGAKNVQTQSYSIGEQARQGVRLFDVRAATFGLPFFKKMKTYHGTAPLGLSTPLGTTGQGVDSIFEEARDFVSDTGEFMFLKFDKSKGYPAIAEKARKIIDKQLYKVGDGCLNQMQLKHLAGKVFVLIISEDWEKMGKLERAGTLPIYKYDKAGHYVRNRTGMQYVGKGGTTPTKNNTPSPFKKGLQKSYDKKILENIIKQQGYLERLKSLGHGSPFLMGMMYWTATGVFQSIERRNDYLWNWANTTSDLQGLWKDGVGEWIEEKLPKHLGKTITPGKKTVGASLGYIYKQCLPNFVMIDFANKKKCETIYALNKLTGTQLGALKQKIDDMVLQEIDL